MSWANQRFPNKSLHPLSPLSSSLKRKCQLNWLLLKSCTFFLTDHILSTSGCIDFKDQFIELFKAIEIPWRPTWCKRPLLSQGLFPLYSSKASVWYLTACSHAGRVILLKRSLQREGPKFNPNFAWKVSLARRMILGGGLRVSLLWFLAIDNK